MDGYDRIWISLNNTDENSSKCTEDSAKILDETVIDLDIHLKRPPLAISIGMVFIGYPARSSLLLEIYLCITGLTEIS